MTRWTLHHADCRDAMRAMEAESIDAIVTDPPYGIAFMGREWDHGVPGVEFWAEALRVAKPGAHLVAFGGTRTYHRLACAIEDAGWEVRDCLSWLYGSGFPKSFNISIAIDKAAGAMSHRGVRASFAGNRLQGGEDIPNAQSMPAHEAITDAAREWQGWGTALKPAWEPIILARKPLVGTVAANVLEHGTGAINVDACRIGTDSTRRPTGEHSFGKDSGWNSHNLKSISGGSDSGRWPANVALDEAAASMLDEQTGERGGSGKASGPTYAGPSKRGAMSSGFGGMGGREPVFYGDSGGASRFFYTAKASRSERGEANTHPTVKPVSLMRWLVRLVTPPNGLVLDPFNGSGSTGVAALAEGMRYVGCEREAEYVEIARRRLESSHAQMELL